MTAIRQTAAKPVVTAASTARTAHSFGTFLPYKSTLLRDGGSIILTGNLNRSVVADVRLDGGLNSPTRGKFFATTHLWTEKTGVEKPMTKAELKQLKVSLQKFMASARMDKATHQTYSTFMQRLDEALGTKPAATK